MALSSKALTFGFIGLLIAGYGGSTVYSRYRVSQMVLKDIQPGKVNLIGVNLEKGYKILVANQMAQLAQMSDGKGADFGSDDMSGLTKKRVPIREMLQSLQGNTESLGKFIMVMNDMKEDDLPPTRVIWEKADIEKAISGDKQLEEKLVNDLNVDLSGNPLPKLKFSSLENGIVLRLPVKVNIIRDGVDVPLVGYVLVPFKPKFTAQVEAAYAEKSNFDRNVQLGIYAEKLNTLKQGKDTKEDVREGLRARISEKNTQRYAETPQNVLRSVTVIVSDAQLAGASFDEVEGADLKKMYTVHIHLKSEGADRLWKYSQDKVGSQILFVQNGIAIAAPRITHELSQRDLEITQIADRSLVTETVDVIRELTKNNQ